MNFRTGTPVLQLSGIEKSTQSNSTDYSACYHPTSPPLWNATGRGKKPCIQCYTSRGNKEDLYSQITVIVFYVGCLCRLVWEGLMEMVHKL
jgi:hypothetical protein